MRRGKEHLPVPRRIELNPDTKESLSLIEQRLDGIGNISCLLAPFHTPIQTKAVAETKGWIGQSDTNGQDAVGAISLHLRPGLTKVRLVVADGVSTVPLIDNSRRWLRLSGESAKDAVAAALRDTPLEQLDVNNHRKFDEYGRLEGHTTRTTVDVIVDAKQVTLNILIEGDSPVVILTKDSNNGNVKISILSGGDVQTRKSATLEIARGNFIGVIVATDGIADVLRAISNPRERKRGRRRRKAEVIKDHTLWQELYYTYKKQKAKNPNLTFGAFLKDLISKVSQRHDDIGLASFEPSQPEKPRFGTSAQQRLKRLLPLPWKRKEEEEPWLSTVDATQQWWEEYQKGVNREAKELILKRYLPVINELLRGIRRKPLSTIEEITIQDLEDASRKIEQVLREGQILNYPYLLATLVWEYLRYTDARKTGHRGPLAKITRLLGMRVIFEQMLLKEEYNRIFNLIKRIAQTLILHIQNLDPKTVRDLVTSATERFNNNQKFYPGIRDETIMLEIAMQLQQYQKTDQ